jgi:hypothetical protein
MANQLLPQSSDTKVLGYDSAVGVEQESGRNVHYLVRVPGRSPHVLQVGHLRPGQPILLYDLLLGSRLYIERDAEDSKACALGAEALVGGEHSRVLGPAGFAPRSSEIDQYVAAPQAAQRHGLSGQVREGKVRGEGPDC